jgi:hypothetical protein
LNEDALVAALHIARSGKVINLVIAELSSLSTEGAVEEEGKYAARVTELYGVADPVDLIAALEDVLLTADACDVGSIEVEIGTTGNVEVGPGIGQDRGIASCRCARTAIRPSAGGANYDSWGVPGIS